MTNEEREAIFSKEVLTTKDVMKLYGYCQTSASAYIKRIKRVVGDRLGLAGRIYTRDYQRYIEMTGRDKCEPKDKKLKER